MGPFMMQTMKGSWFVGTFASKRVRRERAPSPGVAPSLAFNGRCGIRLAPGDRRLCRRRGRPL
jgi:hypothetical protein